MFGHQIVFRTDASLKMGTGHVMRCLTLADALQAGGAQCHFICREHPGNLIAHILKRGFTVSVLPAASETLSTNEMDIETQPNYEEWLGADWEIDAKQTKSSVSAIEIDWLIVDHYAIDARWEQVLRPLCPKLMVIDDLANRQHVCDVLLDQNYSGDREQCYSSLVPNACKLLVGPRYALLHPEYVAYRNSQVSRNVGNQTVLVFFGGSDLQNMTGFTLNVLTQSELCSLNVDVVIGANNPHRMVLEKQVSGRSRTRIHGPRPHLADLMAQADLSVGAGGATTWERMCLGLPSIVMSVAENQRSVSEALAQAGLIEYIGDVSEVNAIGLAGTIKQLIEDRNRMLAFASKTQLLVDGLGTARIADILATN